MRMHFFRALETLMRRDPRMILLTSDTGAIILDRLRRQMKDRCVNAGIAESNMIGVAAGLASEGRIVFCFAIVPFITMRCYEQIRVSVCVRSLPVKLVGVGPGVDYSTLGPTHHGLEDLALMRALPGMTVFSPADNASAALMPALACSGSGPAYIRLDRGGGLGVRGAAMPCAGSGQRTLAAGTDTLLVSTGTMTGRVLGAVSSMKDRGRYTVLDIYRIKPLDETALLRSILAHRTVATFEEHSVSCGLGEAVGALIARSGAKVRFSSFGLPDAFCRRYGSREFLLRSYGLDTASLACAIRGL